MKIAVIILNWNGKKDTLECLSSLQKIEEKNFTVIVADNGSTDHSIQEIGDAFPEVIIIDNKRNLGFAEGNNRAIEYTLEKNFDAILLLNNDTIVDPSIFDAFIASSIIYPNAILGAKVYLHTKKETFDHLGGIWNKKKGNFDLVAYRATEDNVSWESPSSLDYVCGCSLFAKAEVFKKVGLLDPRFFLFWEESDFCFRAKKLGYEVRLCPQAKIWHKVSASFIGGKPHTTYFLWRNRFLWVEKNLLAQDAFFLYLKILIPESLKVFRHYLVKSLEYRLLTLVNSKKCTQKKDNLLILQAAFQGIIDYLCRRFYNGPSWIYKKR